MSADILFKEIPDSKNNKLAQVILNRPKALNALSYEMLFALDQQLRQWECDRAVKAVVVTSNSEKAFCAGGDIRAIYDNRDKSADELAVYFDLEYSLNRLIFHYKKPYISFLDGITMGGGIGISLHGSHVVGTEKLRFAMPESLIGFFPDIGASYHLSRLQDFAGYYLGLTGNIIGIDDAYAMNLVGHFIPSEQLDTVLQLLIETPFSSEEREHVTSILRKFDRPVKSSALEQNQNIIKKTFSYNTVEEILAALQQGNDWSQDVANVLLTRSPTSLKVTFEQFNRAKKMDFNAVSQMDFTIAKQFLKGHDFYEGIRAAVVDKDKIPKWSPSSLEAVEPAEVLKYF